MLRSGEPVTVLPLEAQGYCSISDANWSKAGAHRQQTHLKQSEESFCRSTDGMSVGSPMVLAVSVSGFPVIPRIEVS